MDSIKHFLFGQPIPQAPLARSRSTPLFPARIQTAPQSDNSYSKNNAFRGSNRTNTSSRSSNTLSSGISRASNYFRNSPRLSALTSPPKYNVPAITTDEEAIEILGHIQNPFMFYNMLTADQIEEHPDVEGWLYQLWNDPQERSRQVDFLYNLRDLNQSRSSPVYLYSVMASGVRPLPSRQMMSDLINTRYDWTHLPPSLKLPEISPTSPFNLSPVFRQSQQSSPTSPTRSYMSSPRSNSPPDTVLPTSYLNADQGTWQPKRYMNSYEDPSTVVPKSQINVSGYNSNYPVVSRINEDDENEVHNIINGYYGGKTRKTKRKTKSKQKSKKRVSRKRTRA